MKKIYKTKFTKISDPYRDIGLHVLLYSVTNGKYASQGIFLESVIATLTLKQKRQLYNLSLLHASRTIYNLSIKFKKIVRAGIFFWVYPQNGVNVVTLSWWVNVLNMNPGVFRSSLSVLTAIMFALRLLHSSYTTQWHELIALYRWYKITCSVLIISPSISILNMTLNRRNGKTM